jgi:hypothetical protein
MDGIISYTAAETSKLAPITFASCLQTLCCPSVFAGVFVSEVSFQWSKIVTACYAEMIPIMLLVFPDVSALCNLIKLPADRYPARCHDNDVLNLRMIRGS